jgi:hypothetical protein
MASACRHPKTCTPSDSCTAAKAPCWITSSACAGNAAHRLSRRAGTGGIPRRPCRGACTPHRVERTDRDARHEARSTRSRATSSTKPPPTAAARDPARRQSAEAAPHLQRRTGVLRQVTFRDRSSVCYAPGIGTQGSGTPYGVTHTRFAIVSRSALVSKSQRCCKQNMRLAVESFLEF